jgi:hypothetical protein
MVCERETFEKTIVPKKQSVKRRFPGIDKLAKLTTATSP